MERDYILRLIEQVAALLASIIAKERAGQYIEAKADVDEKARQVVGIGLNQIRKLPPEAVWQLSASSGGLRHGRAVMLAELLLHDAVVADATGDCHEALVSRIHAFCLLSETVDNLTEEDRAVYREKLKALAIELKPVSSHPYLSAKFAVYQRGND